MDGNIDNKNRNVFSVARGNTYVKKLMELSSV